VNTSRQVGGSIGLALLATVATSRTADVSGHLTQAAALSEGFGRAFLVGAAFAAAGAIVSMTVLVAGARRPAPQVAPELR
jgi:hypothetical protein